MIIEPVPAPTVTDPSPRPRTRSERPISDIGTCPQPHPPRPRTGYLPTRLSSCQRSVTPSPRPQLTFPSLPSSNHTNPLRLLPAYSPQKHRAAPSSPPRDLIWLLRVRHPRYEPSRGVSVPTDRCIYQSGVFTASTPIPTVDRKTGATEGKGTEYGGWHAPWD